MDFSTVKDLTILTIEQSYFKLPDDFSGNKFDALLLMAQYLYDHQDRAGTMDEELTAWQMFKLLYPFDEKKAVSAFDIQHWDGENWEWVI